MIDKREREQEIYDDLYEALGNKDTLKYFVAPLMYLLLVAAVAGIVLLFVGCKGPQTIVQHEVVTEYRDRVEYVEVPADSAVVEALMRCDEEGNVLLSSIDQVCGENSRLQSRIDSIGRLTLWLRGNTRTIPVEVHDTIWKESMIEEKPPVVVEVPAALTRWQKFRLKWANVTMLAVVLIGGIIVFDKARCKP